MTKKLFIRSYTGRLPLEGEIEVGWNFTDETGTVDLCFGQIQGGDDQAARLQSFIAQLRKDQKSKGLIHDFEIEDRRSNE